MRTVKLIYLISVELLFAASMCNLQRLQLPLGHHGSFYEVNLHPIASSTLMCI